MQALQQKFENVEKMLYKIGYSINYVNVPMHTISVQYCTNIVQCSLGLQFFHTYLNWTKLKEGMFSKLSRLLILIDHNLLHINEKKHNNVSFQNLVCKFWQKKYFDYGKSELVNNKIKKNPHLLIRKKDNWYF